MRYPTLPLLEICTLLLVPRVSTEASGPGGIRSGRGRGAKPEQDATGRSPVEVTALVFSSNQLLITVVHSSVVLM